MSFVTTFPKPTAARRRLVNWASPAVALLAVISLSAPTRGDEITPAFAVPRHSRGLAWAWGKLWVGGVGDRGEWIYGLDPELGVVTDSLPAPAPGCLSLEGHQDGLVFVSPRSDSTYFISRQGVRSFPNPYRYVAGLASDGSALWCATYFEPQGMLLQLDNSGRILKAMPYGGRQSRDMTFLNGRLYVTDQLSQNVRVVNPTNGRLIRSFATPGANPSGIATDGEGLWLLDEGDTKTTDRVYRIAVRPEGGIRLSALQHNFGSEVINESHDWVLWIYNDGAQDTRYVTIITREGNEDIFFPHLWNFPATIAAGDSVGLTITFNPAYPDSVRLLLAITYDLDRVENVVNLRGKGVRRERDILVAERILDFGLAYYGAGMRNSNLRHLVIESNGGDPLTLRELNFDNGAYSFGGIRLPHTFERPGAYRIPIFFRPNRSGFTPARMTVVTDDPDSPQINVSLRGQAQGRMYPPGNPLWNTEVGDVELPVPRVRAVQPIDDVTGDGLADVVIASNDYVVGSYHAASTLVATPYWSYRTDANPWRAGRVPPGRRALSEGGDWDRDGVSDIVFGLDGGALTVVALSGLSGRELWIIDTRGLRGGGGIPVVVQGATDLTGDDVRDVFVAVAASGEDQTTQALCLIDGRTAQVAWLTPLPAAPVDAVVLRDVTGDELPDLVVVCADGTVQGIDGRGGYVIWENDVQGDVRCVIVSEDVNGDGSQDICPITFVNGISMLNGSNGTRLWLTPGMDRLIVATPLNDVNGNGSSDIVFGDHYAFLRTVDGRTGAAAWDTTRGAGSRPLSVTTVGDADHDGISDFIVGLAEGRIVALSGNGRDGLWSYGNPGEDHGFMIVVASRDLDGNGEMDVLAAMQNGTVFAFAGSYVGQSVPEPELPSAPWTMILSPAYPNPFNSSVSLPLRLGAPGEIEMRVFDVAGREVISLGGTPLAAGEHRLVWNGINSFGAAAPSGTYILRVSGPAGAALRQVQLIR